MVISSKTIGIFLVALLFCASCATLGPRVSSLRPIETSGMKLTNSTGQLVHLQTLIKKQKATVLIWWSSSCPCVKRYRDRVEKLRRAFSHKNVAMYLVSSNADDDVATVRKAIANGTLTLPLVIDHDAKLAQRLHVISTPSAVLLDQTGRLKFHGWIDNERQIGESGRIPFLKNAITGLLTGKPTIARSQAYGCLITKGNRQPFRVGACLKPDKKPKQCGCK